MTSLDPEEVTSPEGVGPPHTQRQEQQEGPVIPSSNVSTSAVPPPPRQRQQQRQHLPSLPSSLVLLSTSTTDPSLFSFDIVKKLNQEHLATIPPNPYSAISIAQHQQQSYQSTSGGAEPTATSGTERHILSSLLHPPPGDHSAEPLSQLRRASAPDITAPGHRIAESSSTSHPPQSSTARPPTSQRLLSSPRRSLDELSLRRAAEQRASLHHHHQQQPEEGSNRTKMTATLGYGASDLFGGFNTSKFHAFNSNEDPLPSARRTNVIPQTRELYLHPSQIFTPSINNSHNGASGYFDSSQSSANEDENGSGLQSTIALPPMLTLEEIIQPHIFAKQEPIDTLMPITATFGVTNNVEQAPAALQNANNIYSGATSLGAYPDFTHDSQNSWYSPGSQPDARGTTYSSYLPPDPHGANRNDVDPRRVGSPSLQHAQDIMAFSERVAMPPMPKPAPGSLSPSSLSPGDNRRDLSPSRPSTRDGLMSQRSNTPQEAVPQKRSGKLPATVTATLKNWLLVHTQHPYPTEEEKRTLCSDTGLTMNQVSNWFINARRRILPNLGTVAMSSNRKQLTQYNPPGPRRVFSHGRPQGYPPFHAESEGMYPVNGHAMAAARMRGHPYANYGPSASSSALHNPLAAYNYNSGVGPY